MHDAGTRALMIQLFAGERLLRCHPRLPAGAGHSRSAITPQFYNGHSRPGILSVPLALCSANLHRIPPGPPRSICLFACYRILSIAGSLYARRRRYFLINGVKRILTQGAIDTQEEKRDCPARLPCARAVFRLCSKVGRIWAVWSCSGRLSGVLSCPESPGR